jgi:hypothetical protein
MWPIKLQSTATLAALEAVGAYSAWVCSAACFSANYEPV